MGWSCPVCKSPNQDDQSRCSCGQERYGLRRDAATGGEAPVPPRRLPLVFQGSAVEYFRIWIVNLCLMLLTGGIFSAWAKVRKKRYLYLHTTLDKTPFQYLGQPLPILKGRLIAVLLFLVYYASRNYFTSLLPYVIAAGSVIAPWVIVRSAAFNARYSAFRNMTFRFGGRYPAALRTIHAWGVIPCLVAGSFLDWWSRPVALGIAVVLCGLAFPWWMRKVRGFLIGHTSFGGRSGVFSATGWQFFKVYAVGALLLAGGVAAMGVIFGLFSAAGAPAVEGPQILFLVLAMPVYAGYVIAYAYLQAHSSNLTWNHTRLGPLWFSSSLTGRGMAKLYITNALGIVVSLGLLIPWAVMRTVRYRVDHLQVLQDGDLDLFQGSAADAVQAVGAETLDLFDMDLSL